MISNIRVDTVLEKLEENFGFIDFTTGICPRKFEDSEFFVVVNFIRLLSGSNKWFAFDMFFWKLSLVLLNVDESIFSSFSSVERT